jgi:predicted acylesterase/phospholipase RssA
LGTAAWLDGRTPAAHHHVRQGDAAHMQRLARRLTGQAISLVLSGGGARGFVHGGVYRAMLELGIPIDYFGGTSMGALIAGLLAAGATYEDALGYTALVARRGQLFDYTLPLASLNRSAKVSGICRQLFGDLQIEDLWYPYFCIASNLTTAEPVVQQRGPLWLAVRASISIPGVFAPVNREGELLVDGGPMNNFPVDVMAELSESPRIIGVHASPHTVRRIDFDYETHVSGWRILAGRLNPFARRRRYPSITGTMLRAMEVNNAHQARGREALADLVIYPDARQFGILDFSAYEAIMELGYQAALEPLRAWKARQPAL